MQEIGEGRNLIFQIWALKHREVKQLTYVHTASEQQRQASWFNDYADKTFAVVVPYLSLLWFVMHTQPVLQVSWASSQHEHRETSIKMREKRSCTRSRAAMIAEP